MPIIMSKLPMVIGIYVNFRFLNKSVSSISKYRSEPRNTLLLFLSATEPQSPTASKIPPHSRYHSYQIRANRRVPRSQSHRSHSLENRGDSCISAICRIDPRRVFNQSHVIPDRDSSLDSIPIPSLPARNFIPIPAVPARNFIPIPSVPDRLFLPVSVDSRSPPDCWNSEYGSEVPRRPRSLLTVPPVNTLFVVRLVLPTLLNRTED
ncbi:hypothetical protein LXL04_020775 [Taraxacum kok-saghyz]